MAGVPHKTAADVLDARSVYTIQSCSSLRPFMESHVRRRRVRLAVTCHLHLWQNDRDISRATAVTRDAEIE